MMKNIILISAALALIGTHAVAGPAQDYNKAVECAALYDFSLQMVGAANPQYNKVKSLYNDWKAYSLKMQPSKKSRLDGDITAQRKKISQIVKSGNGTGVAAQSQFYMQSLAQACRSVPVEKEERSSLLGGNPFSHKEPSDSKTYIAAVQCAGVYVVEESRTGPTYTKFLKLAKMAKPERPQKEVRDDISEAMRLHINRLIESKLEEYAVIDAQCKTALKVL